MPIRSSWRRNARQRTDICGCPLFQEDIANALLAQSAPLLPGSATLFSYVQNVDQHPRPRHGELAADQNDVIFPGLELSASLTYADGRIAKDTAFAAAVNKRIPASFPNCPR